MLIEALPQLPIAPMEAICHCLENEKVSVKLANALLSLTQNQLQREHPSTGVIAAAVRGVSRSRSVTLRQQLLRDVLASPVAENTTVLAAISGRAWESLSENSLRPHSWSGLHATTRTTLLRSVPGRSSVHPRHARTAAQGSADSRAFRDAGDFSG